MYFSNFFIKAFKVFIQGFGDIPQQAKIDEFIRSESKRICQFFVSEYALTVLATIIWNSR